LREVGATLRWLIPLALRSVGLATSSACSLEWSFPTSYASAEGGVANFTLIGPDVTQIVLKNPFCS